VLTVRPARRRHLLEVMLLGTVKGTAKEEHPLSVNGPVVGSVNRHVDASVGGPVDGPTGPHVQILG